MRGCDDVTIIFASADHEATVIADLHDGARMLAWTATLAGARLFGHLRAGRPA
jgi:urease accessory protein UreH